VGKIKTRRPFRKKELQKLREEMAEQRLEALVVVHARLRWV
jgi:hypothetical protein